MILLHDNARLHVVKVVKDYWHFNRSSLTTYRVFTRLCVFRLLLISIDAALRISISKYIKK